MEIRTLLTDNGREFTDRAFGKREKDASGGHEFDALCQALGIEHRLTKPKHPQTNGMVERFNGRLAHVLKSHRFNSAHDLETTLPRFVWLYNEHLAQRALNLHTPIQALKKWQSTHPDLFSKRVVNHSGPDITSIITDGGRLYLASRQVVGYSAASAHADFAGQARAADGLFLVQTGRGPDLSQRQRQTESPRVLRRLQLLRR